MNYQPREYQQPRQRKNIAQHVAQLKQAPNRSSPDFGTENLSKEQQYEIALSDCNYAPDKVQGHDEFKPGGMRYNPSKLYNLKVLDRQKGYRMLGVSVIGDTWTDPRTPAGRALHAQHSNHLHHAGNTRLNEQGPPAYQPSRLKLYEQVAQQIGEERIKQNAVASLEKCQRYRDAISLKTSDQCISEEEKNKYIAKGDRVDAVISDLQKGLGNTKELPKVQESNLGKTISAIVATVLALSVEDLALLGLIATLCFQLHETLDDVTDAAIDDLLRDTGVERGPKKDSDPGKAPKPLPTTNGDKDDGCEVKPVGRHLGNDPIHDQCADYAPPNVFMGSDVLVVTPSGRKKHFDAMDASGALWEVKTENFSEYSNFIKKITIAANLKDIKIELKIAKECGRKYVFAVSDEEQYEALKRKAPPEVILRLVDCL